ncbi:MAG: DUF1634 domain-containing protein [Phycisphaerales bacterium]
MKEPPTGQRAASSPAAKALNWATVCAAAVLALGVVMMVSRGNPPQIADFAARERQEDSIARVIGGALRGEPGAVALLGVVMLLAIPAARTLAAGVGFLRAKDRLFAGLAVAIVAALVAGLW